MTGKQIAANLRKSKRKWGTDDLYDKRSQTYCVLGIKAAEKGIKPTVLEWFDRYHAGEFEYGDTSVDVPDYDRFDELENLIALNDHADSKEELISTLEGTDYRDEVYDVEKFVKYLKSVQKKRLHLK